MIRATVYTGITQLPPEGSSLKELYDFFERKDRYDVADMFLHIKNFLSWESWRQQYSFKKDRDPNLLNYHIETVGRQVVLILTFKDEETVGRFKEMAPRSTFHKLVRV